VKEIKIRKRQNEAEGKEGVNGGDNYKRFGGEVWLSPL
jgi:hypothetical protein